MSERTNSKETILQIIPAPPDLLYGYPDRAGTVHETQPVVCLALIEQDGERMIKPMGYDGTEHIHTLPDEAVICWA